VGGQEISRKRLAHVQPSEMIRFILESGSIPPGAIRSIPSEPGSAVEVALR
jgi:hypothetical protein